MDSGKGLDDDGPSTEVSWLQRSMLPTAPFSVVCISYDHPGDILGLVIPRCAWDVCILSSELVSHLVHLLVEGIGGTVQRALKLRRLIFYNNLKT